MSYRDFGITELILNNYKSDNYSCNCLVTPHPFNSIAILQAGRGVLSFDNQHLALQAGDVFFIGKDTYYRSDWFKTEEEGVSLFSMHFLFNKTADFYKRRYPVQRIAYDSVPCLQKKYQALRELLIAEKDTGFDTVALFFGILSEIVPKLVYSSDNTDDYMRKKIQPAIRFLTENYDADVSVGYLSDLCLMSRTRFFDAFKKVTGSTPIAYKNEIKLTASANYLLDHPEKSVENIASDFNYSTPIYFIRQFKQRFGVTPYQYRKKDLRYHL